jgi:hypothetical protein
MVSWFVHHSSARSKRGFTQGFAAGSGKGDPGFHRPRRRSMFGISESITARVFPSPYRVALR